MKYIVLASIFTFTVVHCQFFDPILDDKTYLDNIQKEVVTELEEAKNELMVQARVVENVTRAYITAKLKENVFKTLRLIAENELRKSAHNQALRPKSPKQETEDEDEDETTPKTTTELTGLGTAVKVNQQVFGFLGEAFKIIFGGAAAKPKRKRGNIEPAEMLMSKSQDVQLLGVVSLLARDAEDLPPVHIPTTEASLEVVTKYPGYVNFVKSQGSVSKKGAADDDLESAEDEITQDARIFDLFALLGLGRRRQSQSTQTKVVVASKNETLSGFDEEAEKRQTQSRPQFSINELVKTFRQSMVELQASVPDIYRGVREAYKLLETVRGVAERVEEYFEDRFD